jgi:hypothetical protein
LLFADVSSGRGLIVDAVSLQVPDLGLDSGDEGFSILSPCGSGGGVCVICDDDVVGDSSEVCLVSWGGRRKHVQFYEGSEWIMWLW